ncbi:hypothetical protein ACF1GT_24945 [Streptomyces sp. NPDC014636]|uniref:hypothetical protein n=1 Tax=Streptomyces sp. NPDC014636 TaxID=3364876 RepID=UPI0036F75696
MRLRTSLSLGLAATVATAAPLLLLPAGDAHAVAEPACAGADARAFPLATRIRGGPGSFEAGGGYGTWYIDLTNTTRTTCAGVHPVVVLVDDKRALRANQPQLDFYDGPKARPVTFETTDQQELVGVLAGSGFGGFTVPPGRTVSVRVRLALTSDAVSDQVTAHVAAVQRRGEDGDWVGESNAYRFGIDRERENTQDPQETEDPQEDTQEDTQEAQDKQDPQAPQDPQDSQDTGATGDTGDTEDGPGTLDPQDTADASDPGGAQEAAGVPTVPAGSAAPTPTGTGAPDSSLSLAREARELARTGPGLALGLLAAVAALFAAGAGAFLLARSRR